MDNVRLEPVFLFSGTSGTPELGTLDAQFGVNVTAYGLGQVSAGFFSVPPGGVIEVDFTLRLLAVTPDSIKNIENLIKSLLDASRRERFEEESKIKASGGLGFNWFWSGGAKASYEKTKQRMEEFGLSEENQKTIVEAMVTLINTPQDFNYRGTVNNTRDFTVSGSLFLVTMDATVTTGQETTEIRVIAPNPQLRDSASGDTLPVNEPLY